MAHDFPLIDARGRDRLSCAWMVLPSGANSGDPSYFKVVPNSDIQRASTTIPPLDEPATCIGSEYPVYPMSLPENTEKRRTTMKFANGK